MGQPKLAIVADQPIRIEKGAPIPPPRQFGGRPCRYPLRELEVGDSFFVPSDNPPRARVSIDGSSQHLRRRLGRKFVTRIVDGGVRCWRIA